MHQLAKEYSQYQEANQLYGKTGKYRFLQFSEHAVQGAIDMKDPKHIVLEYPRAIIHLMDINEPFFERVFMIGHGIGTIASHYPDKQFRIAEIDEKVLELSRLYFEYHKDNVVIGDGFELLMNEEANRLDYIILDAFTKAGTPHHLTTLRFFQMTKDKLNARGSIILNLTGKANNDRLISAIYTTLKEVYTYSRAFSLPGEDASDVRNIIVIGSNKMIEFEPRAMAGFIEIELEQGHIIIHK
ncbi:MAG: fused MFS/spermidine synthase [Paenibacillaceae bacterium]